MKKMLIALDGSERSMKAVHYAAHYFAGIPDLKITLFHVLPSLPAGLWEKGHILTEDENLDRQNSIDKWVQDQKYHIEPVFKAALSELVKEGVSSGQIGTKSITHGADVAESILSEAQSGGYDTILLGRRGLSGITRFLVGSVALKVIGHATGMAVCVVE